MALKHLLRRFSGTVPATVPASLAGTGTAPATTPLFNQTDQGFRAAPVIEDDQPGFLRILDLLENDASFAFCKINHGFWERLARLEASGIDRESFATHPGDDIDARLGVKGSKFAEGGMLADLLTRMRDLPSPEQGMHFVASLSPWPGSARIEGTPYENRQSCEDLIAHFVPQAHRDNVAENGFTGHEFKVAAITGGLGRFLDALRDRQVIFVGNASNRALFDSIGLYSLTVIEVDATEARLKRDKIRARLFKVLKTHQQSARPPVVIGAAGGSLTSWLGFQVLDTFERFHFVDLGGTLAAYSPDDSMVVRWTQTYRRQLAAAIPAMGLSMPAVTSRYSGKFGLRDRRLVELACAAGVPAPASCDELPAPAPTTPIPFIENKIYDHQRLAELLSLSVKANHHANGGPVAALLERMVALLADLPEHRRVVAVCNGTAALHIACGLHALEARTPGFRWVTSAFNFFSAHVGPLSGSTVIDCNAQGRFHLDALRALPLDSYDGVVYTNIFAQQSDWDDIAAFCAQNGKQFVVDNATGLLDRPDSARKPDAPIEIISAHHTKPWGVGEGGFVICDAEQETAIRKLANFAAALPNGAQFAASNYKLSDLSAAAIIDRLERKPWWGRFYKWQERRMHSLVIDADVGTQPFPGTTTPHSPRAHTPFLCLSPVVIGPESGPVTLRKYYRPLPSDRPTPNADDLYARIFNLSNAPEMRLVPNEDIVAQIRRISVSAARPEGAA
ncbi:hypothetical protein GCM10011315_18300 [Roseovarius pacificus]|nr:hypothetical protein GCM10011315_18300 [Roseovarius pacificus]